MVSHLTAAAACLANSANQTSAHQLNTGFNVNNLQNCKADNSPDLTALIAKPSTVESFLESVFKIPDGHALNKQSK